MAEAAKEAVADNDVLDIDPKTLLTDDEKTPVKEPEAKEEPKKDDAEPEVKADEVVEETPKAEGTPDKALQKVQQELAAATRTLGELKAKSDSGESLTATEQKKLARAETSVDRIRKAMTGDDFDVLDNAKELANAAIEGDAKVSDLEKRLARMEKREAEDETSKFYSDAKSKYPGVDHEAVWAKAASDAVEMMGLPLEEIQGDAKLSKAAQNSALKMFHERSGNAAKAIAARNPAPKTNKAAPPITPGGAKVTANVTGVMSAATTNEEVETLNMARSLIRD